MKNKSVLIRMTDSEFIRIKMLASVKQTTVTDVLLNGVNEVSTPEKKEGELVMKALAEIISVVHEQNAKIEEMKSVNESLKKDLNDLNFFVTRKLSMYIHLAFLMGTSNENKEHLFKAALNLLNIEKKPSGRHGFSDTNQE